MTVRLAAIDVGQLAEVLWVSLAAGIGVTVLFALVVRGSARSTDARRSGRDAVATAYGALAVLAFLAFAAIVVIGVKIMLAK